MFLLGYQIFVCFTSLSSEIWMVCEIQNCGTHQSPYLKCFCHLRKKGVWWLEKAKMNFSSGLRRQIRVWRREGEGERERWAWEGVRWMEQEAAKRPNQKSRPRRGPLGQANHLRLPPISLIQLKSIYWEPKSRGDLSTEVENECDTAPPLRKSHSCCESPRDWGSG